MDYTFSLMLVFMSFIPSDEMEKNLADSSYQPRTVLINEVEEGMSYELVISVLKGRSLYALSSR